MTVTGWRMDEVDAMPFREAAELFQYWTKDPPIHLLLKAYVGYKEPQDISNDPVAMGEAVKMLTGSRRAPKLSTAPKRDQERFAQLKEQAKKLKKHGR